MNPQNGFGDLDPKVLAYSRNAVLGIPDSGKTVTAKNLAEMLMGSGVPITALDPAGNWRFLRVAGKGKGFPVVVVGGADPDIPLPKVDQAANIMRAAMQSGVSVVFDLYDPHLSKGDWKRVVQSVAHVLYYENKPFGLRHLFIEEAAEFVPQRVNGDVAGVYSVLEKIARMGRNAALGVTFVNQRAEEINKAVLELCDNLFLHRQKGRRSLQNLERWLAFVSADGDGDIIGSLPTLPSGQCWFWAAGRERPALVRVPMIESYHPNVREMIGQEEPARRSIDVGAFVEKLRAALPKIEAELQANDPRALRDQIARLSKELAAAKSGAPDPKAIEDAFGRGRTEGFKLGAEKTFELVWRGISEFQDGVHKISDNLRRDFSTLRAPELTPKSTPKPPDQGVHRHKPPPKQARGATPTLKPAHQRVIDAIAWWGFIGQDPVPRDRAAVVAGYSPKASTFGVYIGELVRYGLVEVSPGCVALTAEGIAAAAKPNAATREDLRKMARELLKPQEARVFDVVYEAYPDAIEREAVANAVGLSPTASTCGVYLGAVAAYGMIEPSGRGMVRAADWLFP